MSAKARAYACLLTLACLLPSAAEAREAAPLAPWMLAPWRNPAPHLADLGMNPGELALAVGRRLVIVPHAPRDIVLPSSQGPRAVRQARFLSTLAVVDLPADTVRRRLGDFGSYRSLFPLLPESEVLALDGAGMIARYRLEVPLPATATFAVDFRVRHTLEPDGSISALLIDGTAESLIARLGGMSDNLADQPVVARWEFLPLNPRQSLVVFTYWSQLELRTFFARKFMGAYPELKVVEPYLASLMIAEAVHRNFTRSVPRTSTRTPPGLATLAPLQGLLERGSRYGVVVVLEPDLVAEEGAVPLPLRYVTLVSRVATPPTATQHWATQYHRLPETQKELRKLGVRDRGREVDLDMDIHFGVLLMRFSLDLKVRAAWTAPDRLEFARTAGELAQLRGASEWHALPGEAGTLMLVSAAHEVGEEAPLLLRLAHRLSNRLPYVDQLGSLATQMVVMERLRPWLEKQAAPPRKMAVNE